MDYRVLYSARKTLALTVTAGGEVVVRASPRHPASLIQRFVSGHGEWIARQRERVEALRRKNKQFAEGERFLYLGKEFPLHFVADYRSRLVFDGAFFLSAHKRGRARELFTDWYRRQAQQVIAERLRLYAGPMRLQYRRVSIKNMTSRWGSCSAANNLNFCWRLVLAPLEVLDYVLVHELAHIAHKNHSRAFWLLVQSRCPRWKVLRQWLRDNGDGLSL